jgi:hypothetical protein
MILSTGQIKAIKELGSPGAECINDLLDTIESQATQIEQLQAQVKQCREYLIECKACQMMPGRIEAITTEALQAIEKIE